MRNMMQALLLCFCVSGLFAQKVLNKVTFGSEVDQLVRSYRNLDIFSGVVLVAEKDEILYHRAFGLANREAEIPNTLDTKFDVGSMNKSFTGMIILDLLEEEKLKLSDKIGKYLTGISSVAAKKVTINHLMNHTSGYGDYFNQSYLELPRDQKTFGAILNRVKKEELLFDPGTDQVYSNSGYVLLGAIIEAVTGKDYFDVVEERIINALELSDTDLRNLDQIPNRATGYYKDIYGNLSDNSELVEFPKPDGGFFATAMDVYKFYQEYHYGTTVLSAETKMNDEFYDMIQAHRQTGGAIPHSGGYPGSNSVNYEILRDQITVVVLANMDEPVAERLGANILRIIRGQEIIPPNLPANQAVLNAYLDFGIDHVKANFERLTTNFHPTDPRDFILNDIGYQLLHADKVDQALEMFQLNSELFPEEPNVWDSLGDAFVRNSQIEEARSAYQKALNLDPMMDFTKEKLNKL